MFDQFCPVQDTPAPAPATAAKVPLVQETTVLDVAAMALPPDTGSNRDPGPQIDADQGAEPEPVANSAVDSHEPAEVNPAEPTGPITWAARAALAKKAPSAAVSQMRPDNSAKVDSVDIATDSQTSAVQRELLSNCPEFRSSVT